MKHLLVDIGAGTMDVLYFDDAADLHCKAVVLSPVRTLAAMVDRSRGPLLVTGCEMGGGPVTAALRRRAETDAVVMTASSAATVHHQADRVRGWGIRIVDDDEAVRLAADDRYARLTLGDLEVARIERIVRGFGVPFSFDVLAVCAQDHGAAPAGVSHLDYRHSLFEERLRTEPFAHTLLFQADELPSTFSRLSAIAASAAALPAREIYVMDSGMAAILGASMDAAATGRQRVVVLDMATSHTVGATLAAGKIAGFFEYHTHDITRDRLETLVRELADGRLDHRSVLAQGGHGATILQSVGFDRVEAMVATGPRRGLLVGTRLPVSYGAPLGDNMMTGTVGLLEAVRRRKGRPPISYI